MKLKHVIANVKLTSVGTKRSTVLSYKVSVPFQGQQEMNSTDLDSCSPVCHVSKAKRMLTLQQL